MNRTLTASVALAATLGIAGLAHAQQTTPSTQPAAPSMAAPAPGMNSPSTMPNSPAATNPSSMTPSGSSAAAAPSTGANPATATSPSANAGSSYTGDKQASMSQSSIQQAQQQLKAQGLYNGAIDGIMGPQTERAVSQFQQQNGLPKSAGLDQQTLDRLMSAQGQGQSTQPSTTPRH